MNAWFPLRIKKPAMEAAVEWRVNILAAGYIRWAHVATRVEM
jgi:hypothetical protein